MLYTHYTAKYRLYKHLTIVGNLLQKLLYKCLFFSQQEEGFHIRINGQDSQHCLLLINSCCDHCTEHPISGIQLDIRFYLRRISGWPDIRFLSYITSNCYNKRIKLLFKNIFIVNLSLRM